MTKKELITAVAEMNDMTKSSVEATINAVFGTIQDALVEGHTVDIPGFGKFHTVDSKARRGRNPSNGEAIDIPAKTNTKFKVAKALKDAVA